MNNATQYLHKYNWKTKKIKILTLFRVNGSGSRPYFNSFIKVI